MPEAAAADDDKEEAAAAKDEEDGSAGRAAPLPPAPSLLSPSLSKSPLELETSAAAEDDDDTATAAAEDEEDDADEAAGEAGALRAPTLSASLSRRGKLYGSCPFSSFQPLSLNTS